MTQSESIFMPRSDYLRFYRKITTHEREILINWLIIIQVEFNLLPETLFITINIIDRYLSKQKITLNQLQLFLNTFLEATSL